MAVFCPPVGGESTPGSFKIEESRVRTGMNSVNNNYPCLPSSSTSCVPGAYSETPTQQFPIGDGGVYVDDYEPVHHEDDDIGGGGVYTDDYEPEVV
ncbi:hypothetical protein C5167_013031 [Papaver somniferum]|uniref:Uncharacterized protein n=1 Tax=Papaver somniferum TaxID=3469 RepID=A0A4Y7J355_PAPSO|nr:hypothetical protein C5167_013031 [Papaver somniferum]